jgi:AraC-like DNA-binding protein
MAANESIQTPGNLPFSAEVVNLREEPLHFHKEIELLLVLRGSVRCKVYHLDYALEAGDMLIADVNDLHRVHGGSGDVLLLRLHVDTDRFEEIYPGIASTYFVCEDPEAPDSPDPAFRESRALLRQQLARLTMDFLGAADGPARLTDHVNGIIATLMGHFRGFYIENYQYRASRPTVSETDLGRMARMTRYLLDHYEERIALEELAASEHLNPYYASHLVKKTLGLTFQQFLNAIRLEFAEKKLAFTRDSLTRIAGECGFSSPDYFNRCFFDWHGITPAQYRKALPRESILAGASFGREEVLELAAGFLDPSSALRRLALAPSLGEAAAGFPFAPWITLASQEELLALGYLRDEVLALAPAGFLVAERLLTPAAFGFLRTLGLAVESAGKTPPAPDGPPVRNTAQALSRLAGDRWGSREAPLSLLGTGNGLFLGEGLATPLYTACRLLAGQSPDGGHPSGRILACPSGDSLTLLLFNPDPGDILTFPMETKNLPEQFILVRTEIPEENNCYTLLAGLGSPARLPFGILRQMDQAHRGVPRFSLVSRRETPVLDTIVYPYHVAVLEFTPLG